MTFDEFVRRIIFAVVWIVLVIRTPSMVRARAQHPLWRVLVVFAGGSVVIQSWFGSDINAIFADAQFNNLFQGLWGVLNMAVTLEFVTRLAHDARNPAANRITRISWAAATAAGMVLLYEIADPNERFSEASGFSPFTAYALLAATYMIGSAIIMTCAMGRHLPVVRTRMLLVGLAMMTVGNATQVPFMTIRTLQRMTEVPSVLLHVAFVLNTIRFVLVPLGCVVAALEPMLESCLYWYRRVRIYSLWRLLREATPELALAPPISRIRDLLATGYSWDRLHRRVVEIRDSIVYLHDAWASPELLNSAIRYAAAEARPRRRRILIIACWLAATQRVALSGAPKTYLSSDRKVLPELLHDGATGRAEIVGLLKLQRAVRSRSVREFVADEAVPEITAES